MTYTRNGVYNYVSSLIQSSFTTTYCTSRRLLKPSQYPCVYIHEIDKSRPIRNIQLDWEDNQWESSFEIQITCNTTGTAASEAYSIMDVARNAFNDLFYRQFTETMIDNVQSVTLVGRFRRVIGGGDVIPTLED